MSTNTELIARLRSFETDHKPEGWPAIQMRDVSALLDTIEKLQAEVERLKAELSWTEVLLEECKMDWSGDVTQLKAEHAHETSSLKSEAELKVEQLNSRIEEHTALCIKRFAEVTRERNLLQTEVERLSAYNKLFAAPIPQQPSVPEGWKLVPIEPTPAMLEVGFFAEKDVFDSAKTKRIHVWKDMIAAAPQPKETK